MHNVNFTIVTVVFSDRDFL